MKFAALLIFMAGAGLSLAQEDFVPPQGYPVDRYEAAWKKNPFTLKTAPIAIEKVSFAKDLALGAVYQIGEDTTVVVVNTKTRERFKLINDQPSTAGLKVKAVFQKDTRKDSYVEVEAGGELATLRYDENYQKQMVGQAPPPQQQPQQPGMATSNVLAPGSPGAVGTIGAAPVNQPGAVNGAPAGMPAGVPRPPGVNGPMTNGKSTVPTPARRRLLTAPAPR